MNRRILQRLIVFTCVMTAVIGLIYSIQSRREKRKAAALAQQQLELANATAAQKAAQNAAAERERAVQDAAHEHRIFLEKYVDTGITKTARNQLIAVAVASEYRSMNHAVAAALVTRFKTDHVQLTDSFFKPELVTDGLFNSVFNGSSDLFNKLELAKSLDALLLARQDVQYSTNKDLDNTITANMRLEVVTLPVAGQAESQEWTFTANGIGFRPAEARMQAEERIIKQIANDTNLSLSLQNH
ncbi:MAG: hypothetical protein ABSC89_00865 [Verrucomicrobiota bacterium]|jgi:hypothetical protein